MVKKMKKIAIIPARGGSKRIPNKNIIDFHGKPMIAWTIEAALQTQLFDKVIVSTDDQEIADISKKHGAHVPFMREQYADDHSPISLATINVLERLEEKYDIVVQLMANCPIRNAENITIMVNHFINQNNDFLISCFEYGWMNPWWAFKIDDTGTPEALFKEALKKRSQDLDKLYCPSGAIWIGKVPNLIKTQSFYGPNHKLFPIPWKNAMDIDDYEDLSMAKAIFNSVQ